MLHAWNEELMEWVQQQAAEAGFDRAGVASAPAPDDPEGTLTAGRFASWIADGRAGDMVYLERRNEAGELLRQSARTAIPWARSVLVCALNYNAGAPRSTDPAAPAQGWIARYAWSGDGEGRPLDYHDDLLRRLRLVESALQTRVKASAVEVQTRCYVDTGPLLERDFAVRAGIGWTGKNTCILNQELGSWLLLGVIVCSLPVEWNAEATVTPDRCGTCTRCLEACPTGALVAPREMDASLCISYLTIEKKGIIPHELRPLMGRQVFGCDICQDVCPWNRKAPAGDHTGFKPRSELINPALDWLAAMDQEDFRRWFRGSPLERTKSHRLQRNVAIAMGNSGDQTFAPRLVEWAAGPDEVLAEAAAWALEQLLPSAEEAQPETARIELGG